MRTINVVDKIQTYSYDTYECDMHKDFKPVFSPMTMLRLGVFEGNYLNDSLGTEFPIEWKTYARISDTSSKDNNLFSVRSGLSLKAWQDKGWIHKDDPRGWFQWFCRYYVGRRHEDDQRQINRWQAFVRFANQIRVAAARENRYGDVTLRPVVRQALLQWSYDPFPELDDINKSMELIESLWRAKVK
jgi:hypothetical protein